MKPDENANRTAPLQDHIDSLVLKYDDWHECDEYHIHDGTGEHEGHTPLPHDFDDTKFKQQLTELVHHRERIAANKARIDELSRMTNAKGLHAVTFEHLELRLAELNKEEHE